MHLSHMKEWFLARGYPKIAVNNQTNKVVFGREQSVKLRKMIRDLLPFLYSDGELQKVFHLPRLYLTEMREK